MRIDVVFSPAGLAKDEVAGRAVFVVDVLRATTVACAALHHGARAVIPVGSIEEAIRMGQTLGSADVRLIGERNGVRIPGFALGNSPLEMTEQEVRGKTLVMTTTNGTQAMLSTQGAALVYLAAAANLSVAGARGRQLLDQGLDLLILCSGRSGAFSLDDAYAAGRLALAATKGRRGPGAMNDAALAALDLVRRYGERWDRPLRLSAAGRHLAEIGLVADVIEAGREDRYPSLPQFHDRRISAAPSPLAA
jgi:2-phosphosulfolactate phosphatase